MRQAAGAAAAAAPLFIPARVFGANERVVMGIVGSGGRGRGVMGDLMAGGAVFSAVCDVFEPNLAKGLEVAAREGATVTAYTDFRRMLEHQKDMDAVLIATPEHQHCRQLVATVQAGYDCYCEKPMSYSIDEGAWTVRKVRRTDRIVQIGMQRRSSPAVRAAKELFDQGVLGEVFHARAKWNWHYYRVLDNSPLEGLDVKAFIWPARNVRFEPMMFREWRYFWKFSGGNITDQGTHLMDVIQWFLGKEFEPKVPRMAECFGRVYKMIGAETPDIFTAIYEYDTFSAEWTLNYTSSYQNSWSIEILGTQGAMVLDDHGWRVYDEPWRADERRPWESGKPPAHLHRGGIPTRPHTDNFLQCVKSRDEPNAPVEIGHLAVVGPHLANLAYHKEKRAYLDPTGMKARTRP